MSYTESQAVFESRLSAVGFDETVKKALLENGVTNLATLAFISEYNPSSSSEKPLLDTLEGLIKREPTVKEKSSFRRLFHEAYALATNEMKTMVEKGEEVSARKLSQPERHDRYVRQVEKLSGVSIKGVTEPSDGLVDLCCSIFDDNRLRWVDWSKCTSKEQEMTGEKKDHTFTVSNGAIKIDSKPQDVQADTTTDVLVQYALQRRALAFDQANLMDYSKFMRWTDKLMKSRIDKVPAGFERPSIKQLMDADVKLFEEMADRTRQGIQPTPAGRPLDEVLERCMVLHEVSMLLQPRQAGRSESSYGKAKGASKGGFSPYSKGKGKGKGKSKSKFSSPSFSMPSGLEGCWRRSNKGENLCFSYNLGRCVEKVENGRCRRGLHVCCAPKCGGNHPAISCDKLPSKNGKN